MVSGDITLCTYGTVTDVVGDKVYGFGHSLLGYGQVDLPMATAKVHTVVSTIASSFKLASLAETVGALAIDESAGVIGRIGKEARTIPLTIRVDRFNDTRQRVYNCRLAYNRLLTPLYLRATVVGAALQLGDFPPDHTLEYKIAIGLEGGRSITSENVSTGLGLNEIIIESISSVGLLMNNPYERVGIESLDYEIRILPKNIVSHIWSAELSDAKVKAGRSVEIGVVLESVLAGKKKYRHSLEIPEDLAPGTYELTVCGSRDYERFLVKAAPYRFIAQSLPELITALNESLKVDRDRLAGRRDRRKGRAARFAGDQSAVNERCKKDAQGSAAFALDRAELRGWGGCYRQESSAHHGREVKKASLMLDAQSQYGESSF
jgi:hypothetical protein